MKSNKIKPCLNELSILITSLVYIIPLLISANWKINLLILALAILNLISVRKINLKFIGYFILIMLFPIFSLFITVLIYTKGAKVTPVVMDIAGFQVYELALTNAIYLCSRAFALSSISFIFLIAIRYDALVFSLMQVFKLSPVIGYSLLVTFNAFHYMKDELLRIRAAWKNRFSKNKFPLTLIFPVLVSASRYAHYAGLSLECRGLNKNKTYLENHPWRIHDSLYILLNLIQIILLKLIVSGSIIDTIRLK